MTTKQKYASFAAEDTREASSLPSDFNGAIVGAKFTREAPDNYTAEGNPLFAVITLNREDMTGDEATVVQSYSLGSKAGDEFTVSDDGFGLIPVDETLASSTRKGSKFDLFKIALEQVGVSGSIMKAGDLSKFLGIRAFWKRVEDEKLLGKKREFTNDKRQNKFPPQTLVAVKLLDGKAVATPTASTSTGQTSGAAVAAGGDIDAIVQEHLINVLKTAKNNTVQRGQLTLLMSKAVMGTPYEAQRNDVAKRAMDESFLKNLDDLGVIEYGVNAKPQTVKATQASLDAAA